MHCPQQPEHPDGHWTRLSLEKADDESPVKVPYFETLNKANEEVIPQFEGPLPEKREPTGHDKDEPTGHDNNEVPERKMPRLSSVSFYCKAA